MKKISTLSSSLLVIGALGLLISSWLTPDDFHVDLSEEDIHLYL